MGIAYGQQTLEEIGSEAQNNFRYRFGSWWDQVVVKEVREGAKPTYYGGKSATTIKRTRVRSRAMSTALRKILMKQAMYLLWASLPRYGRYRFSRWSQLSGTLQSRKKPISSSMKKEIIPDVERCLTEIHKEPELEMQLITPERAMELKKDKDLLVMVDYHKPSLSISQSLYEQFDKIVIIDHHRRGEEFPSKPL